MKYNKLPKTINNQIKLLKERGLIVEDKEKLARYLKNISYYHFSIYFKHFQKNDVFIEKISFDDILNIYVFDQKLRLLLLDVLERIEKSFKCRLAYEISVMSGNSCWIADEAFFKNMYYYRNSVVKILNDLKFSKEIYIKHYYEAYNSPKYPPVWMIIETLTFGQCTMIYNQLKPEYQRMVANSYGINKKFISNWMHALSIIRNFCAHHSRLWNREMVISLNQRHGLYKGLFNNSNGNRLFNYLLVMQIINCKFNPTSEWDKRLREIVTKHNINISHMGFSKDWEGRLQKIREIEKGIT